MRHWSNLVLGVIFVGIAVFAIAERIHPENPTFRYVIAAFVGFAGVRRLVCFVSGENERRSRRRA